MQHSQRLSLLSAAATLVFLLACLSRALASPAGRTTSEMDAHGRDLSKLASLINKLKHLQDSAENSDDDDDAWTLVSKAGDVGGSQRGSASATRQTALRQGFLGFDKRQGTWSYDYGLGGGRFGKRYYGDYGIGGGRFGRDVDHVDIGDASDVSM